MKQLDSEQQRVMRYAFHMNDPLNQLDKALYAAGAALSEYEARKAQAEKEGLVKRMVDRFLGWKLPQSFTPDGGVSFKRIANEGTAHERKNEPTGTNLLDAVQAEAMVRYILDNPDEGYSYGIEIDSDEHERKLDELATRPAPVEGAKAEGQAQPLKVAFKRSNRVTANQQAFEDAEYAAPRAESQDQREAYSLANGGHDRRPSQRQRSAG